MEDNETYLFSDLSRKNPVEIANEIRSRNKAEVSLLQSLVGWPSWAFDKSKTVRDKAWRIVGYSLLLVAVCVTILALTDNLTSPYTWIVPAGGWLFGGVLFWAFNKDSREIQGDLKAKEFISDFFNTLFSDHESRIRDHIERLEEEINTTRLRASEYYLVHAVLDAGEHSKDPKNRHVPPRNLYDVVKDHYPEGHKEDLALAEKVLETLTETSDEIGSFFHRLRGRIPDLPNSSDERGDGGDDGLNDWENRTIHAEL